VLIFVAIYESVVSVALRGFCWIQPAVFNQPLTARLPGIRFASCPCRPSFGREGSERGLQNSTGKNTARRQRPAHQHDRFGDPDTQEQVKLLSDQVKERVASRQHDSDQ
jgi:hypothetical protein